MRKKAIIIGGIAAGILLIGGIAAASKGGSSAATAAPAAPVTVTVTAPPPAPVTVTAPAPAPVTLPAPPAVTVTVTAEPAAPAPAEAPAANDEASSPKDDGTYIVGSEIAPGNWKCSEEKAGGLMWWETKDEAGEVNDLGTAGLAHVSDDDFSVWLDDCAVSWTKDS
ncbi:MAG TPA: hypothetical protein VIT65_05035 [Microlunatus sp.]